MQTTEDKPLACTLDGSAPTPRLTEIREFTATNLLSHECAGRTLRLRYRPDCAPRLKRIVELEKVCCAFLDFEVTETPADVSLTITAPSRASEATGWLFSQFLPMTTSLPLVAGCGCSPGAGCR